jgi:hypothetical protein
LFRAEEAKRCLRGLVLPASERHFVLIAALVITAVVGDSIVVVCASFFFWLFFLDLGDSLAFAGLFRRGWSFLGTAASGLRGSRRLGVEEAIETILRLPLELLRPELLRSLGRL